MLRLSIINVLDTYLKGLVMSSAALVRFSIFLGLFWAFRAKVCSFFEVILDETESASSGLLLFDGGRAVWSDNTFFFIILSRVSFKSTLLSLNFKGL